jgi:hypothetical protein
MLKSGLLALLIAVTTPIDFAEAQSKKGANGGTVVVSSGHPIEFVTKAQDLTFYLSDDDGSPLQTKSVSGRATVQEGGRALAHANRTVCDRLSIGT